LAPATFGICLHPAHQFIGLAGHRRHHDRYLVAGIDFALDVTRDVVDPVEVGNRRAAKLHYNAGHDALIRWRVPFSGQEKTPRVAERKMAVS
jgi:hypothetical protein